MVAKKYSYVNGVYTFVTDIRYGWQRFHSMKAQYQLLKKETNTTTFEYFNFISYNTPICRVSHITKKDGTINSWRMDVTCYWDCSPSTKRQLARFLREYELPYTLSDIATYMCDDTKQYNHNMRTDMGAHSIHLIDIDKLDGYFESNACQRNSYPCEILTK